MVKKKNKKKNKERKKQYPKKKEEKKREISKPEISCVYKNKLYGQPEKPKITLEISQTRSDIKAFLEKFKSDVAKKKRAYRSFQEKFRKKRNEDEKFKSGPKNRFDIFEEIEKFGESKKSKKMKAAALS